MKSLFLIRHAKSSWDSPDQNDFDRPLNARGIKDAPVMAKKLVDRNVQIDAFFSSPALRAKQTCEYFIKAFGKQKEEIKFLSQLYLAEASVFEETILLLDNKLDAVAVFSHNNGITEFANQLTNAKIDNMPTCCIFAVKVEADDWSKFAKAKKTFWFVDYPKLIS
ncbi:histidine phosphatase family protein [Lacibacter luteus]|uniref:Histidine phosphatase family protein n=1 Tax=Lacibacter luteus TaxID=2508719 RepID=A0A4Q1CHI7_9BACT|nr:histidine phosphatase family protein [Lacibacter luteus]RXK59671.1 histidine phosphatase family protein [Lacibacter luteus]